MLFANEACNAFYASREEFTKNNVFKVKIFVYFS